MTVFKQGHLSQEEILQWLLDLRAHCYVPGSGFRAAVIIRAGLIDGDDFYFGAGNVENVDHALGTHAEEGAIAAMVTMLGKRANIQEVWVTGAPTQTRPEIKDQYADAFVYCCGRCRQQIAGFAHLKTPVRYLTLQGRLISTTVEQFLPDMFTFRQFIKDDVLQQSKQSSIELRREDLDKRLIRQEVLSQEEIFAWLQSLESVDYASHISQAVVLKLKNSSYVAGVKMEEAAFVATSAIQSALAIAYAEYGACVVEQVFVLTTGTQFDSHRIGTLALSSLQSLHEHSDIQHLKIGYFSSDGTLYNYTFKEAVDIAPTSSALFYKVS